MMKRTLAALAATTLLAAGLAGCGDSTDNTDSAAGVVQGSPEREVSGEMHPVSPFEGEVHPKGLNVAAKGESRGIIVLRSPSDEQV